MMTAIHNNIMNVRNNVKTNTASIDADCVMKN